ncbi:MAG: hypothetical protein IKW99_06220 [Bacteroidales bacterium]|nr:hypothetical protein [Bacteroidales bacterium]
MTDLEEYIKQNREAFDDQGLPEGHLERFMERMVGLARHEVDASRHEESRGGRVRWWRPVAWLAVAAALAGVVIFINRPGAVQKDWFADIPEDQASICQAYYDQMAAMYSDILMTDVDGSKEAQLMTIAEETIPLIDQLPEEMGEEERALILKEYYSDLLEGIEKIGRIK